MQLEGRRGTEVGPGTRFATFTALVAVLAALLVAVPAPPARAAQNPVSCPAPVTLVNGGFEQPLLPGSGGYSTVTDTTMPGWRTTAPDKQIEIWQSGFKGSPRAPAASSPSSTRTSPPRSTRTSPRHPARCCAGSSATGAAGTDTWP